MGWVLTGHGAAVCLSSVDLITSSPEGLRGLVGWVHGHAASCGALPSLQRTLSSEYCGVIQAVWGCDQGHDYTMDADPSCGALLLDSALAVKWTWDKETAPRLTQHQRSNPTGATPPCSQGGATTAWTETETEMPPNTDVIQLPSDGSPVGPGPSPLPQSSLPPSGAPGRSFSGLLDQESYPGASRAFAGSGCLHMWAVVAVLWASGGREGQTLCSLCLRHTHLLSRLTTCPGQGTRRKNGALLQGVGEEDTCVSEAVLGHYPSGTRVDRLLCSVVGKQALGVLVVQGHHVRPGQLLLVSCHVCPCLQWALGYSSVNPFRKRHSQDGLEREMLRLEEVGTVQRALRAAWLFTPCMRYLVTIQDGT